MADSTIDQLPQLLAPSGADVAASKTNTDYRIRVGEANGIATLGSDGKVPTAQLPAGISATWGSITGTLSAQTDLNSALAGKANTSHTHALTDLTQSGATVGQVPQWNGTSWGPATVSGGSATWGGITGTLSAQTDLQTALNGKEASFTKGDLVAGSGVSLSGTLTGRLVGTGNVTISATGGGTGTVTSVDGSGGTTGLSFTGGPITTSGTLTLGGVLAVASGGTGASSAAAARTNLGAAAASHTHAIADISSLQSTLDGKANLSGATFTGGVTAPSFTVSSDVRLKSNILDLVDGNYVVDRLRPVSYTFDPTGKATYGFIAQEVEELIPEAVIDNGEFKSIDYAPLIAFLTAKVQELAARVEELEAR